MGFTWFLDTEFETHLNWQTNSSSSSWLTQWAGAIFEYEPEKNVTFFLNIEIKRKIFDNK